MLLSVKHDPSLNTEKSLNGWGIQLMGGSRRPFTGAFMGGLMYLEENSGGSNDVQTLITERGH